MDYKLYREYVLALMDGLDESVSDAGPGPDLRRDLVEHIEALTEAFDKLIGRCIELEERLESAATASAQEKAKLHTELTAARSEAQRNYERAGRGVTPSPSRPSDAPPEILG